MQTVPVPVALLTYLAELLKDSYSVIANASTEEARSNITGILAAAPLWSNSLQPLYELADRTGQPIAGIDIEATGVDPQTDKIVELVIVKIAPAQHGGLREESYTWIIDPGRLIPAGASAVHGIYDQDITDAEALPFSAHADHIARDLAGCIIVGFNSNHYDVPLLAAELARCGIIWPAPGTLLLDPSVIFRRKERRRLSDAVKTYCYQDGETAHRAEADAYQALHVLAAQIEQYPELGAMTAEQLDSYCNNEAGRVDFSGKLARNKAGAVVFAFGKNKGVPVTQERGYANWMLTGDFSGDTKAALRAALK